VKLFECDTARSRFDKPQRALALTYVHGMRPAPVFSRVAFNLIPGVGEYFVFPALTTTGPCEIMVFEGVPGGPMDCWRDIKTPQDHLATSLDILRTFLPWEAERCASVELTDANGILAGWSSATMVWMIPAAGAAKIWVIALMPYLVALCDLTHIVVGSVEILYLVFNGAIGWQEFVYPFA
ncbi:styrene monooxygenase/indole monooxygenase family protein, partial [Escherichia coli]|uniref:styrene monooxygenase/indole monooxygenase family protein n=1 Tax=Escherichia coli TaxID=562 RepID=UPI0027D3178A